MTLWMYMLFVEAVVQNINSGTAADRPCGRPSLRLHDLASIIRDWL